VEKVVVWRARRMSRSHVSAITDHALSRLKLAITCVARSSVDRLRSGLNPSVPAATARLVICLSAT